jgi:hypothetical protein
MSSGVAQNVTLGQDNIAFHSSEAKSAGVTLTSAHEFVINASDEIVWSQDNGAEKATYTITNTIGTWTDLNDNGEVEFTVQLGQRTGKIFMSRSRSSSPIKLRIEMYRGTVNLVPYEFIISSFEKLN